MRTLLIWLAFLAGCAPSARDLMNQAFSVDPPVTIEYELDGSRFYKTRNIVLDAHYTGNQLTSLVLVVALPLGQPGSDTSAAGGGIMLFRSLSSEQRFLAERTLLLNVGGQTRDLGPCAYETGLQKEKGVVENLTAFVRMDLVNQMARADTISGSLGQVPFLLTGSGLAPIRALRDTASSH